MGPMKSVTKLSHVQYRVMSPSCSTTTQASKHTTTQARGTERPKEGKTQSEHNSRISAALIQTTVLCCCCLLFAVAVSSTVLCCCLLFAVAVSCARGSAHLEVDDPDETHSHCCSKECVVPGILSDAVRLEKKRKKKRKEAAAAAAVVVACSASISMSSLSQ